MTADPDKIPGMISDLPVHAQGIVMVSMKRADDLWSARSAALDDWRASAEGLAAVEARGSAMVNAQRIDQLTQKAMDIIHSMPAANGQIPAYQVIDPVFVADRNAKEQQFKAWVQQAPEEQKYAAMLEGFMAPKTYEMLENMMRENMELKQALNNRGRLSAPPIYPSHSTWAPPPPPPPPCSRTAMRKSRPSTLRRLSRRASWLSSCLSNDTVTIPFSQDPLHCQGVFVIICARRCNFPLPVGELLRD